MVQVGNSVAVSLGICGADVLSNDEPCPSSLERLGISAEGFRELEARVAERFEDVLELYS